MDSGNRRAGVLFAIGVIVIVGWLIIGWLVSSDGEGQLIVTQSDGEVYASVSALRHASDLVVSGRITGIVESYVDSAGDSPTNERGEAIPGLPKTIYGLKVDSSFGSESPADLVFLITGAADGRVDDWEPSFDVGDRVVVHLFRVPSRAPNMSPELAERVERYDLLYGLVGGNQGVFDIEGSTAISRWGDDPLKVNLSD